MTTPDTNHYSTSEARLDSELEKRERAVKCPQCNGTGHNPFSRPVTTSDRCPLCKGAEVVTEYEADEYERAMYQYSERIRQREAESDYVNGRTVL